MGLDRFFGNAFVVRHILIIPYDKGMSAWQQLLIA